MRRKVQLWRFVDMEDKPAQPLPASALHRFLVDQDRRGADMSFTDAYGFETQMVPGSTSDPHFILHRIRDHDLPSQRSGKRITDLDDRVQELAEGSHVLLLPRNLVAFVGTGFSPRPGRFADWLRNRVGWDVWLQPVLRPDVGPIIDEITKVTRVEIKVAADEARRLDMSGFFQGERDPLGALYAAQQAQDGGIIGLEMSIGQGSGADQGFFRNVVSRLRGADLSRFRTARAHVHLEGVDGTTVLDFINDKIVAEVEVDQEPGRQRLIADASARQIMKTAWDQFQRVDDVLDFIDQDQRPPLVLPQELIDPATS